MSSKNPWLVVVFGLVSIGLLAETMAQTGVQEPMDEARRGFAAPPISASLSREHSELSGDSYYESAGEREPATTGGPSTRNDGRFFNAPEDSIIGPASAGEREPATTGGPATRNDGRFFNAQEDSIIGPAPPRYQNVSTPPDNSEWAPALDPADGQPLNPGSDTRTLGTALTGKQGLAGVDESPATTGVTTSGIDKTDNAEPAGKSKLTMWITMGLFASLAGNMFFAWVAWDTHAKYQNLVDDRGENDGPPRRQDRRTRGDAGTVKRDRDAIAFGSLGLEE